jgi:hypothetical protein
LANSVSSQVQAHLRTRCEWTHRSKTGSGGRAFQVPGSIGVLMEKSSSEFRLPYAGCRVRALERGLARLATVRFPQGDLHFTRCELGSSCVDSSFLGCLGKFPAAGTVNRDQQHSLFHSLGSNTATTQNIASCAVLRPLTLPPPQSGPVTNRSRRDLVLELARHGRHRATRKALALRPDRA